MSIPNHPASGALICVDMGTTNTRVWIVNAGTIVECITRQVGLRDAARERSNAPVRAALRDLIAEALTKAAQLDLRPSCVLAAGMLTSPLGLCEVPHLPAPAGEKELSEALRKISDPQVADVPIYLVPGIRSGPSSPALEDLDRLDVLRGEETVAVGLQQAGLLAPNATLLHLGSHWKAIATDAQSRISASHTTLSGELLYALQAQTVLASALPQGRLEDLDEQWLERGRQFQALHGSGRAMFGVRLLEQLFHLGQTPLSSFLLGALVESDLRGMEKSGCLRDPILITGAGAPARAWQIVLQKIGKRASSCDSEAVDHAFVRGLVRLLSLHRAASA